MATKSNKATAKKISKSTAKKTDGRKEGTRAKSRPTSKAGEEITETFIDEDGEETTVVRTANPRVGDVRGGKGGTKPRGERKRRKATTGAGQAAPERPTRGSGKKRARPAKPASRDAVSEPATGGVSLTALGERFLKHLEAIGKSRATVFSYSIDVGLFCRELGTEMDVATITADRFAEFFASDAVTKTRTGKPKSKLTIDKSRRVARQVLEFAVADGIIEKSPVPAGFAPSRKRRATAAKNEGDSTKGQKDAAIITDK